MVNFLSNFSASESASLLSVPSGRLDFHLQSPLRNLCCVCGALY